MIRHPCLMPTADLLDRLVAHAFFPPLKVGSV
jgi:hypothetical protein